MKQAVILLFCVILSGCVAVVVQKEIQVRKDASGKIVETVEIERATQQGSILGGVQFDHLKSKETDPQPAVIH